MVLALASLSVLGAVAWALAMNRAMSEARTADRQAAVAAADAVLSTLTATTSSMAGGDVLAASQPMTPEEFKAFAAGVVQDSGLLAVAFAEPVSEADRAAWEARTGLTMKDTNGAGGFAPSAARAQHVVVRFAEPITDATRGVLGFDFLSDPMRASGTRAASEHAGAALVGPIHTASTGTPGLFVIRAVRDQQGQVAGYLASGFTLDAVMKRLGSLDGVRNVGIAVDGAPLVGDGRAHGATTFTFGDRTFAVQADGRDEARWQLPIVLLAATLLLAVLTILAAVRARADRRRRDRARLRTDGLSALADELARETTTAAVLETVATRAGPVVGAGAVVAGRRCPGNPSQLELYRGPERQPAVLAIDAALPLTSCARRGRPVVVASRAELGERYPAALPAAARHGMEAAVCTPLNLAGSETVGAIGFEFEHSLSQDELDELDPTVRLIAQVAGRAYDRARLSEVAMEQAELLNRFTRSLTFARSSDEIQQVVSGLLPEVLDVDDAQLAAAPVTDGPAGARTYPLPSSDGGDHLVLHAGSRRRWTGTDEATTQTVVDLIDGAMRRARHYDLEHAMLLQFQETLLTAPPEVEGYDVAVGYRSALQSVDMGGDWYSVVDSEKYLYVVIGDVAGHGPNAAAVMAEIKTILRFLLTGGTPLEQAIQHAHRTLARRHAYASATIVRITKETGELQYVNAGHLPFIHHGSSGPAVERHGDLHRPWLGIDAKRPVVPTQLHLEPGDTLLLFTDGLVEERDETIDDSIARLETITDPSWTPDETVQRLLRWRTTCRRDASVDDDIALVAVKRL